MRNILFFFRICSECSELASSKGHTGWVYGLTTGVLMLGCGSLGVVLGFLLARDDFNYWSYFFFLPGAALGAVIGWLIANGLKNEIKPYESTKLAPSVMPRQPVSGLPCGHEEPIWCIKCGKQLSPECKKCDACGADVPSLD